MSKSIYINNFFSLSAKTCQNNPGNDDDGTQKLATNVFFVEEDFATEDSDKASRLFYKRHDCNFACRITVSDEQSLIADYKHNRKHPNPAVFNHTPAQADSFYQNIDNIIEDNKEHIPELQLRACYVFHKDFVHKAGKRIKETGQKGKDDEEYAGLIKWWLEGSGL